MRRTTYRKSTLPRWKQGKQKNRKGKKGFLFILLFLIALGGTGYYMYSGISFTDIFSANNLFSIQNISVEGNSFFKTEDIIATSGIKTGTNMFELDLNNVASKLKKNFVVEDFIVYRQFPGTISIRVKERTPVALVNTGSLVGVDAEGVILPHIGASYSSTLPILTGIDNPFAVSDSSGKSRLLAGLSLLKNISEESPSTYNKISEINVTNITDMGITLLGTGLEIIIGPDEWSKKIPNIERVVKEVTGRMDSVKAVDIRFGEKIFVRKATESGEQK